MYYLQSKNFKNLKDVQKFELHLMIIFIID